VRIPRFWAAAEGSATGPQGQWLFRSAWGWSMTSAAEALDVAHERVRAALDRLVPAARVGGYYPRTPLREQILDELVVDGEQAVAITRNRYGAEVLNTDRILIADVDLPYLSAPATGGLFRRLFRPLFRRQPDQPGPAGPPPEPREVLDRLATIGAWARANPDLSVAVYRTASGLRVFVAGIEEPTSSPRGDQALLQLDADSGSRPVGFSVVAFFIVHCCTNTGAARGVRGHQARCVASDLRLSPINLSSAFCGSANFSSPSRIS